MKNKVCTNRLRADCKRTHRSGVLVGTKNPVPCLKNPSHFPHPKLKTCCGKSTRRPKAPTIEDSEIPVVLVRTVILDIKGWFNCKYF